MADLNHLECGGAFRREGFFTDHPPDARYAKWVNGKRVIETPAPGRFDFIVVKDGRSAAVEAKTGRGKHKQAAFFDQIDEKKRAWLEKWHAAGNKAWVYLTVGTMVLDKPTDKNPYPKITVLIPVDMWFELEKEADRKSLSYEQIKRLSEDGYGVEWVKSNGDKGYWRIPSEHPFMKGHSNGTQ